jgi:GntR family transcriptional regulator
MGEAEIVEREVTPLEAERLQVAPGTHVLAAMRVILTGARPVAYLVDVVPADLLQKHDLGEGFSGSVLDLFIARGAPALGYARTDIITEAADLPTARKLHVQRGDMLLKLDSQLFSREGRMVDYTLSYFVPGFFHFHVVRRIAGA